jgi:hypothetical protein
MDASKPRFKNSWTRTKRAAVHLAAFKTEWERIFADHGISVVTRYDKDSGWHIASVSVGDSTIERFENNSLALELGEYAYQLRSALDGLIWDAITFTQGSEPPADANGVYFPVLVPPITSRKFEDCGFLKLPFPKQLRDWLESIQPYQAVKTVGHPDRGLETAIWDINDLARLDRHRRLRIVAPVITQLRFGIASEPEGRIVARERIESFDLFGGQYEFLRFKVETADGTELRKMALKTALAFEVILEDIRPFGGGMDMGSQLGTYIQAVEYIVGRFEREFT